MSARLLMPLVGIATSLKLLLIPAYRSTDFEVHRNWLAITHSLPLKNWYTEATSEWTLDYPPLFAWFEWLLSLIAQFFDPEMLVVSNLNYASDATVLFQRLSVIATDFVFIYAIQELMKVLSRLSTLRKNISALGKNIVPLFLIFNVGLFIVDHIHFQYNGMLFGFLLLSIVRILQGNNMEAAFWFALLLNMKHIYLYLAPAYFVYLLRSHCFRGNKPVALEMFSLWKFLGLGSVVGLVCLLSLGPFIYMGQVSQLVSRLFPFKRGLVHAYWAPNFWALYSGLDKILTFLCILTGLKDRDSVPQASMTGGMVQEYTHTILPSIPPIITLILTLAAMAPSLLYLWTKPSNVSFLRAVILCGFSSFLFGWHVHEKAVLLMIIPMTLLVLYRVEDAQIYLLLSVTGFYSLFPLIFSPMENILKVLMLLISSLVSFQALGAYYGSIKRSTKQEGILPLLNTQESLYILGFLPLTVFNSLGVWLLGLDQRLPFLPLMLTSLYCTLGICYSWGLLYRLFHQESLSSGSTKKDW